MLGWLVAFAAASASRSGAASGTSCSGRSVLAVATYMVASLFLHGSEIRLLWVLLGLVMALGSRGRP